MDMDERAAYLNGEEISLTTREFNLLYKLLSYPKKTFTRTQLMDEFWDAETASGTRTVDVYIVAVDVIRRKLTIERPIRQIKDALKKSGQEIFPSGLLRMAYHAITRTSWRTSTA